MKQIKQFCQTFLQLWPGWWRHCGLFLLPFENLTDTLTLLFLFRKREEISEGTLFIEIYKFFSDFYLILWTLLYIKKNFIIPSHRQCDPVTWELGFSPTVSPSNLSSVSLLENSRIYHPASLLSSLVGKPTENIRIVLLALTKICFAQDSFPAVASQQKLTNIGALWY